MQNYTGLMQASQNDQTWLHKFTAEDNRLLHCMCSKCVLSNVATHSHIILTAKSHMIVYLVDIPLANHSIFIFTVFQNLIAAS